MRKWKLSPQYKKSVTELTYYKKGDFWITQEIGWRWGWFIVTTPDDVDLRELVKDKNQIDIYEDLGEYDIEVGDMDDSCWEDWDYEGVDEDELEAFQEAWDEEWNEGIEKLGWETEDTDYIIGGPFEIHEEGEEQSDEVYSDKDDEAIVEPKNQKKLAEEYDNHMSGMDDEFEDDDRR